MEELSEQQAFFMRWALKLAERGRITAPPNPWVGCVIVREGQIVGEGFHEAPGKPHAEQMALSQAGPLAKGATVYITLEPCVHHGRTPPCIDALIQAGARRVVIPFLDPDPQVSGKGVLALQKAGIEVEVGVAKEEAHTLLAPYLHHRETGRPLCVAKAALSIDGRVAACDGSSQWISSEEARADAHRIRAESQAILVGAGTAATDRPRLTVRGTEVRHPPLRVVLDTRGTLSPEGPLFDPTLAPTLVFTTTKEWRAPGVEVIATREIVLTEVLEELGKRGVLQLLIEGGPKTHTAFFERRLIDQLIVYVGNCLLGASGVPFLTWEGPPSMEEAPRLQLMEVSRFGDTAKLTFAPFQVVRAKL